jgi:hypothetical protein
MLRMCHFPRNELNLEYNINLVLDNMNCGLSSEICMGMETLQERQMPVTSLLWEPSSVKQALPNQDTRQLQRPLVRTPPSDKSTNMLTSDTVATVGCYTYIMIAEQKQVSKDQQSADYTCQQ